MADLNYCCRFISVLQCVISCGGENTAAIDAVTNIFYYNAVRGDVPALFAFGDSIVDSGNNNFIPTLVKANFPPHGRDYIHQKSTGRFCNGKLSTDFLAAGLGLKESLPPYLDPNLEAYDLLTGVSFASAGTGFDNLTAESSSVLPMWKQVEYFKEYKSLLEEMVSEENAANIIGDAIFLLVSGTNDFMGNYDVLPVRKKQFSVAEYEDFLLEVCSKIVEDLYKLGGRKFGVYGIPPPGCLPLSKTLHGQPHVEGCIEELNHVAISYNTKLKATIQRIEAHLQDIKVVYVNIYDIFFDIVTNPSKYGFETSNRGCCGTGLTEVGPTCNAQTPNTCSNASKYVFWDAVHSTQKTYEITAMLVLDRYVSKLL